MDKNKILVVDDEPKISDVVKSYLQNSGYEVYTAGNGKQALDLFSEINPSLIILDLMLPDISGEDICLIIRKTSRVPIIMLTAKVEEEDILKGLNIGADDYVIKPFSPKQLVARVDAVLRRTGDENGLLGSVLTFNNGEFVIDFDRREVKVRGAVVEFTPNEFNILKILAKHPKISFTRDELIYKSMSDDFDGFDRVIDTHIKNLRHKIEKDRKKPQYILTVHGVGYRFGGETN